MEAPGLVQTYRRFRDRPVQWIGVTPEGPQEIENVLQYVSDLHIPWPVGYGALETFKAFGVTTMPTVFVIDRAGQISWTSNMGGTLDVAIERALTADTES
ncbi:MAG: peroxiredoxin family protein [Pirellulales bacterium]